VLSLYTGTLQEEDANGRIHASIAFTREAFDAAGGWPLTKRGDFDQQLLARLSRSSATVDPCQTHPPSYVFRWGSTDEYHGQALMRGAEDEEWYGRIPDELFSKTILQVLFDPESASVFDRLDLRHDRCL
jgi:hypothetical protein